MDIDIVSILLYNVFRRNEHKLLDQPSGYFEVVNNSFLHNNFYESIIYSFNNNLRNLGVKYNFLIYSYSYNFLYSSVKKISYEKLNNNVKKKHYQSNHSYIYNEIEDIKDYLHKKKFEKYENYWKSMTHFAQLNDGDLFIFLQPSLITEKKRLSQNEAKYLKKVDEIDLRKEIFSEFENIQKKLRKENFKIYSMYDLFENNSRELYTDYVHLNIDGNKLIAKYIVEELKNNNLVKMHNIRHE